MLEKSGLDLTFGTIVPKSVQLDPNVHIFMWSQNFGSAIFGTPNPPKQDHFQPFCTNDTVHAM